MGWRWRRAAVGTHQARLAAGWYHSRVVAHTVGRWRLRLPQAVVGNPVGARVELCAATLPVNEGKSARAFCGVVVIARRGS